MSKRPHTISSPLLAHRSVCSFNSEELSSIKSHLQSQEQHRVYLFVGSTNKLKVDASSKAVVAFLSTLLQIPLSSVTCVSSFDSNDTNTNPSGGGSSGGWQVLVTGIEVESGVNEQPVGPNETEAGATNRMKRLMTLVATKYKNSAKNLVFYIGMENGLLTENLDTQLANSIELRAFQSLSARKSPSNTAVVVDRTFVAATVEFWIHSKLFKHASAIGYSQGFFLEFFFLINSLRRRVDTLDSV